MRFLIVAAALAVASAPAWAQPRRTIKIEAPKAQNFSVTAPQSELDILSQIRQEEETPPSSFELGASSWSPSGFSRSQFDGRSSDFSRTSLPVLSINRIAPLVWFSKGAALAWKAGLGFASLERSATVVTAGVPISGRQNLALLSARLGLEYQAPRFAKDLLQPYAGIAALPTLATAPASLLGRRVNAIGLPFEAGLGLMARPRFLADFGGFRQGSFGLGAQYLFGAVDGSSLAGFGAQAFFRVSL